MNVPDLPDPIDAVITWVDGADPALAEKRRQYLPDPTAPGAAATRFASSDEVIWCTLSILRFAPFFRKIWFVTDHQTPPVFDAARRHFPDQAHKLHVVDHRTTFRGYDDALPSFNSTSIIATLHRIPDLAERFVFFNDDFFLVRPATPEDFFQGTRPVLRGGWMGRELDLVEAARRGLDRLRRVPEDKRTFSSKRWMLNAARLAGMRGRTFISTHAPYPMRRSTLAAFERQHPELWHENLRHRFRRAEQFVPEALANHLELKAGNAITLDRHGAVYIHTGRITPAKCAEKLHRVQTDPAVKFLCVQNLDQAEPQLYTMITEWLDTRLPGRLDSKEA